MASSSFLVWSLSRVTILSLSVVVCVAGVTDLGFEHEPIEEGWVPVESYLLPEPEAYGVVFGGPVVV